MFQRKVFGGRLRELRRARHETQDHLATLLGVTVTQISDLENGKTTTTFEKLVAICEYYNISADYLLGLKDEP